MISHERALLRRKFLYSSVEAGLATRGIVLLDHVLFRGLVESFLGFQEPFLGASDIGFGDGFASAFDRRLDHTFDGAIAKRVLGSDTHVLLGGCFDRHKCYFKLKSDENSKKRQNRET